MWLVQNNAILTKDNLIRRQWKGSLTSCFCDQDECMHHLFSCCNAQVIWATFAICLGANDIMLPLNNAEAGAKSGYQVVKNSLQLELLSSGGQFGKTGIRFASRERLSRVPLRLCHACALMNMSCVCSYVFMSRSIF